MLAELFAPADGAGRKVKFWYDAHRAQGIVGYALFFVIFALIVERLVSGRLAAYVFRWPGGRRDGRLRARGRRGPNEGRLSMGMISVGNLRKEFVTEDSTVVALEDASFELEGHEAVSVVGPSGCGSPPC